MWRSGRGGGGGAGAAGEPTEAGYAQIRLPVGGVEVVKFVLGSGEADLQSFDLPEPALPFGFGDAGAQVVPDLGQPWSLRRVGAEQGAIGRRRGADHRGSPWLGGGPAGRS